MPQLDVCLHLNTFKIQGHPTYISILLSDLAFHTSCIPNLAKLVVDCSSGQIGTWIHIAELIAARIHALNGTTNALEELELIGAPEEWHGRTLPSVGFIRFTS